MPREKVIPIPTSALLRTCEKKAKGPARQSPARKDPKKPSAGREPQKAAAGSNSRVVTGSRTGSRVAGLVRKLQPCQRAALSHPKASGELKGKLGEGTCAVVSHGERNSNQNKPICFSPNEKCQQERDLCNIFRSLALAFLRCTCT